MVYYKDKLWNEINNSYGGLKTICDIELGDRYIPKGTYFWEYNVIACNKDRTRVDMIFYVYNPNAVPSEAASTDHINVLFTCEDGFDPSHYFESVPNLYNNARDLRTALAKKYSAVTNGAISILLAIFLFTMAFLLIEINSVNDKINMILYSAFGLALFGTFITYLIQFIKKDKQAKHIFNTIKEKLDV